MRQALVHVHFCQRGEGRSPVLALRTNFPIEERTILSVRFRLREILEKKGMSQAELARRTGLSFSTVHRLASNKTAQVSLATLGKISRVLGCKPGDLIEAE